MEHFLQKVSSQKDPSQSKYDQQKILQELQAMQLEKFQILGTVQELERKIENLMINSKQQKIENKQSGNNRQGELETKFNQFAELTESIFLQKISINDPMDVEQQTQTTYISYRKLRDADIASNQDTKCENTINLQERNRELEKLVGKLIQNLLQLRRLTLQEKIFQVNKEIPYIQQIVNTFNRKLLGFDVQEEIKKSKIKIIKTHDTEVPINFEVHSYFKP